MKDQKSAAAVAAAVEDSVNAPGLNWDVALHLAVTLTALAALHLQVIDPA